MFENLQIRNYRIFKKINIDKLCRINVIAGSNNSGKTSLLEAIFLLTGAGNAHLALNNNVVRVDLGTGALPIREIFWKPFFTDLDVSRPIKIEGFHLPHGHMSLRIASGRQQTTEVLKDFAVGNSITNLTDELSLRVQYKGPSGEEVLSNIFAEGADVKIDQPAIKVPFRATILQSRSANGLDDALRLANLRKQKQDHLLLDALQVVEPRLQSIEENSSSGTPMIWGDIGLPELIPLAVMGEGMTRLARLVLAISDAPGGVVLVDEVENGIHHSVLRKVWRVVDAASKQHNTQVIATTHSLECVRAAYKVLAPIDFGLHRLEARDGATRCISYDPESLESAIKFNFEVR